MKRSMIRLGVAACVAVGGCLLVLGIAWGAPPLVVWGGLELVAAFGLVLRATWGLVLGAVFGVVLCAATSVVAVFSVLMTVSERGSLDDPMFGTGIVGVLNGWASVALYAALLVMGLMMIAAAWVGISDRSVTRRL